MIVRGAPAIGVSAAMGVALGVSQSKATDLAALSTEVATIGDTLAATRPTAVNLFWAIQRMRDKYNALAQANTPIPEIKAALIKEAQQMYDEDIAACKSMGVHGAAPAPTARHRPHPLQRRRSRHLRLRHRPRSHSRRRRARPQDRRLRRRDPPLPSGRAPHRVGAAARQHPHHRPLRQHGRLS